MQGHKKVQEIFKSNHNKYILWYIEIKIRKHEDIQKFYK